MNKTLDLIRQYASSKTVFGLFVIVAGMFFKDQDPSALTDSVMKAVLLATDTIGAVLVLWGRMTAKGPMVQVVPKPSPTPAPTPVG